MSGVAGPTHEYFWVNEAPIEVLTVFTPGRDIRLRLCAEQLKAAVEAWRGDLAPPDPGPEGAGVPRANVIQNAIDMCDTIAGASLGRNEVAAIYPIAGLPVGLMILDLGISYVSDVVVHPGVVFGGPIMMEWALNELHRRGQPETLQLWALDDSPELLGAYAGMGFVSLGAPQSLQLDPAQSDKWQHVGVDWRYVSRRPMGPLYASTRAR